jgi:hypothetical protein
VTVPKNVRSAEFAPAGPVSRADRRRARSAGASDGRRGRPFPSEDEDRPGRPAAATSEFLRAEADGAREFAQRRLHLLVSRRRDLVTEIVLRSGLLVKAYDDDGDRDTTHLPRLKEALAYWSALVNAERLLVEADAHHRNRLIEIYWSAVLRTHHLVRALADRQREAVKAGTPIPAGLEMTSPAEGLLMLDLHAWQPVKVDPDLSRISPVQTLYEAERLGVLDDRYDYGALPRAIEIINHVLSPTGAH